MRITVDERLYGFSPKHKALVGTRQASEELAGSRNRINRINISLSHHQLRSYYIRPVWF